MASIDTFLAYRRDLMRIGKHAIAQALVPYEVHAHLFDEALLTKNGGNWYGHLFRAMLTDLKRFRENALQIVTFNYDRSLEYYLSVCMQRLYNIHSDDALQIVSELPIWHVHGCLGHLFPTRGFSRDYDAAHANHHDMITRASKSIQIVHEDCKDDTWTNARAAVQLGERV